MALYNGYPNNGDSANLEPFISKVRISKRDICLKISSNFATCNVFLSKEFPDKTLSTCFFHTYTKQI